MDPAANGQQDGEQDVEQDEDNSNILPSPDGSQQTRVVWFFVGIPPPSFLWVCLPLPARWDEDEEYMCCFLNTFNIPTTLLEPLHQAAGFIIFVFRHPPNSPGARGGPPRNRSSR
jgi:hypothetical protein